MKDVLKRILLFPFRPVFGNMTAEFKPKEEDVKAVFCVLADVHMRPEGYRFRRLKKAFCDILKARKTDALIFPGDMTDRGTEENWAAFKTVWEKFSLPKTVMVMGNHDDWNDFSYENAFGLYRRYCQKMSGVSHEKPYFSQEINGCKLIGIASESSDGDVEIGEEQISFLDNEIKSAPVGQPVFVVSHYALNKTHGLPKTFGDKVYDDFTGGIGRQSDRINEVLQRRENVFLLSGHSHMGLCDKKSNASYQKVGRIHSLNLPCYMFWNHDGLYHAGIGYVVEVYEDKVVLRPRSFLKGVWLPRFDKQIVLHK